MPLVLFNIIRSLEVPYNLEENMTCDDKCNEISDIKISQHVQLIPDFQYVCTILRDSESSAHCFGQGHGGCPKEGSFDWRHPIQWPLPLERACRSGEQAYSYIISFNVSNI